jgi:glutamine amidotransferase
VVPVEAIIIDYDAGNVRSVQRACAEVGITATITADPEVVRRAGRVIFPGVGSAESAVDTLHERGLDEALKDFHASGKPLLGICLGCQILLEYTEEGERDCLGLLGGEVLRFDPSDASIKVPHIGWNQVTGVGDHPMLKNVREGDEFYFVHSYYCRPTTQSDCLGRTEHGIEYCSILGRDNLFATQFHLEKSGEKGLSILSEFKHWAAN